MYDQFSADYDRFVNWESRLAVEIPFIEQTLRPLSQAAGQPVKVLDAACGTGMHAIALAQRGFATAAADLSAEMVERGKANAKNYRAQVDFETAGFGELAKTFQSIPLFPFDALLCLGNSLPHLLSPVHLATALNDFAACLRPGGLLLIQNRNFDAVLRNKERWMEPQFHRSGSHEQIFLRFYDFDPDGLITFNIITLSRDEQASNWKQHIHSTRLAPQPEDKLKAALGSAGFTSIHTYGSLSGTAFDPQTSGNLVLLAQRK